MIFIWGSTYKKNEEGTLTHDCVICQNISLQVYSMRKWFTFFFVPIFPYRSKEYYMECARCGSSYTLKHEINIEKLIKEEEERKDIQDLNA